ncbi:MAG TPA: sigma-70 family RNA polymerase sigma factor [Candidatus Bathyarchaeia archaeon]|nr:sigma-70 family RNA polymerase sigma factor [Candidatus Bathyarchaeia archaeon]
MFRRSDGKVVARVLAGYREEYGALVERYWPLAYSVGFAHAGNFEDARDVAQDALVAAFQRLDTLRETEKFAPWLAAIARNVASKLLAKRRREKAGGPETVPDYFIPDLEGREMREMVHAHLMQMDEGPREVLVLHYFSGMSTREIGRALAISSDAAEKRLQRARKELGDALVEHLREPAECKLDDKQRGSVMALVIAAPVAWETAGAAAGSAAAAGNLAAQASRLYLWWAAAAVCVAGGSVFLWQSGIVGGAHDNAGTELSGASVADTTPVSAPAAPVYTPIPEGGAAAGAPSAEGGSRTITGCTLNIEQKPVSGATVQLVEWKGEPDRLWDARILQTTSSDDQGTFCFHNVKDDNLLVLACTQGTIGYGVFYLETPGFEVPVPMFPAKSLTGRVTDSEGRPVADARVSPFYEGADGKYVPRRQGGGGLIVPPQLYKALVVKSDAEGLFSIPRVWPGTWWVLARAEGTGFAKSPAVHAGTTGIELVLEVEGGIEGTVIDSEGAPVAGATVIGLAGSPLDMFMVVTGADGRFAVDSLPPGPCGFHVKHARLQMEENREPVTVLPGQTASCEIVMKKGGTVTGRLTDASTGEPVAGATVRVFPEEPVTVDDSGHYRIDNIKRVNTTLDAGAPGYESQHLQVFAGGPGQTLEQNLQLVKLSEDKKTRVRGRVQDEAGQPVSGASVWVGGQNSSDTAADGTFEIAGNFGGPVYVLAHKLELSSELSGPFTLNEEGLEDLTLTLRGGWSHIRGRMVNGNGQPVPDIDVRFKNDQTGIELYSQYSNQIGWFQAWAVLPGTYTITARTTSFQETEPVQVEVPSGSHVDGVLLTCGGKGKLTIEGVVVDDTGKLLPGQSIWASSETGLFGVVVTDEHGRFIIRDLEDCEYTIQDQKVAAGTRNVRVVMPRTATIIGRVVLPDGTPADNFQVGWIGEQVLQYWRPIQNHADPANGEFELRGLGSDGTACVVVKAEGFSPGLTPVSELKPGETRRGVVVRLEGQADIAGRVILENGKPLAGAKVFVQMPEPPFDVKPHLSEGQSHHQGVTNENGEFVFHALYCLPHCIWAEHEGYPDSDVLHVEPIGGKTLEVTITLPIGGTVTGRVTMAGRPVAGAGISLLVLRGEQSDIGGSATTGADGKYKIEAVMPEVLNVRASIDGRHRTIRDVAVSAGRTAVADFDFPAGSASIAGQVLVNGEVPKELFVSAWSESEQWLFFGKDTAEYHAPSLPAGNWIVGAEIPANEVDDHHGYSAHREVNLIAGQILELNFELPERRAEE